VKYHKGLWPIFKRSRESAAHSAGEQPSHLEAVNPVVEGIAAPGRIKRAIWTEKRSCLSSFTGFTFAGQGIVAETLNLSQLEFTRRGTVHIVINNQILFLRRFPRDARSTRYAPMWPRCSWFRFHVHGENPEAALHVVKLACDYRIGVCQRGW
jgi:2-oxoglutarate dehydrogenase E1 component